jgi:hypothetical protein
MVLWFRGFPERKEGFQDIRSGAHAFRRPVVQTATSRSRDLARGKILIARSETVFMCTNSQKFEGLQWGLRFVFLFKISTGSMSSSVVSFD